MTAEELKTLIMAGNAQKLLDALPGVAESERTKLAKVAVSLVQSPTITGDMYSVNQIECCAFLAVFGLGSWEQVRRLDREQRHRCSNGINLYEWIIEFVKVRRPDWIERWVSHQLANDNNPAWGTVRKLIRTGLCPTPTDDNYIIKMVNGYWGECVADKKWQLADSLLADPGLLEVEIWKLFEVEPPGKGALLWGNDICDHAYSWGKALKVLSASGEIDRGRLLTESLEALRRGRRAAGATWFFKFHEYLEPTLDERAERQSLYLDLLSNAVPAVVTFALDALGLLAKEKRLDAKSYLHAVPRVFEVAPKGPPVTAIKLLGPLVKQQPDLVVTAAVAVCRALGHESPDVQKAAITWLESLKLGPNDAVAGELDNRIESVAASLRERVKQLRQHVQPNGSADAVRVTGKGVKGKGVADTRVAGVESSSPQRGKPSLGAAKTPTPATRSSDSSVEPNEHMQEETALRDEIAALTESQRAAAGIDTGLRVLDHNGELVAVPIDPLKLIHLLPEHELTPIASLDELIEELSSAIESPIDADQFERLLDGFSRLCDQHPPDFATRTAPLLKRTLKLSDRVDRHLSHLIETWCQNESNAALPEWPRADLTILGFMADRTRQLGRRVQQGRAMPLLSAPTHRGGWLSPPAFVERLVAWQQTGTELETFDLVQAFIRLAPDRREEALMNSKRLVGHVRQVVRFALGAEPETTIDEARQHPALWIAAGRGRDPSMSLADLLPKIDGPDTLVPAVYDWRAIYRPEALDRHAQWHLKIKLDVTPAIGSEGYRPHMPTLKLHFSAWGLSGVTTCIGAAMHRVWPLNPDPTFATGAVVIAKELDAPASTLRRTTEFLEPLFAPQTCFSELAQLLVAVSLLAKDSGLKGYATDALIALIEDGRCVGDELGCVFRRLLISDAVKCNRLAEQLGEVARVTPLHAHVCSRIVQTMFNDVASLPNGLLPNDAHHLLAPLLEWLVELDEPLREATRGVLATVTGSSKTAKLAKGLLARTSPADPVQWRQIVLASLRGRLPRARLCQQ